MPIIMPHRWEQIQHQRCFLLFLSLLALLIAVPFLSETDHGRVIVALVNVMVLLTAVAAVGRSWFSFVIAFILVLPALIFRLLALESNSPGYFACPGGSMRFSTPSPSPISSITCCAGT